MKEDLFHHVIQQGTLLSNIIEELPKVVGEWRETRGTQSRPSDPIYESARLKVAPLTPSLFSRIPVRTQKIPQSHPSDPLNWYLDFCVS